MQLKLFLAFLGVSLLLSAPSIVRIPRMIPFLRADVRATAPRALEELRSQGLWLVNIDLLQIEQQGSEICFNWEHRYTSRMGKDPAEILTTCIPT